MAKQDVTLQPTESKAVTFEAIPHEARTYQVSVNGLTGSFTAVGLLISFTNPHHTRTWAWKPSLYDINTQKWQPPPTSFNDPAAAIEFLPTGNNFLLYVSEYWRDRDGHMQTSRYGPYLIEAPVPLRGDYTWDGGNEKLIGEHTITGQDITGTENRCIVTGTMTSVSYKRDTRYIKGAFQVEELHTIYGLGAAQYFINKPFTMYRVYDSTAHDDEDRWKIVRSGDRITMDLYLAEKFLWYGRNVHLAYKYPAEQYRFSGSAKYVRYEMFDKYWYDVTARSSYLSRFGVVILQWDIPRHKIDKLVKVVGPITDYGYYIREDHYIYVLAHPDPKHPFSSGWVKEEWRYRNWRTVASDRRD